MQRAHWNRTNLLVSGRMSKAPILAALFASLAAAAPAAAGNAPELRLRLDAALQEEALRLAQSDDAADEGGDAEEGAGAEDTEAGEGEDSTVLPDKEVQVGGTKIGESVGGATGFVFKQGFYAQSELGGYQRFGGFTINNSCGGTPCEPVIVSQFQPFIGLAIGYDFVNWLGVQASFGTGFVANAAPYDSANSPRDFGMSFLNLSVVGSYYFLDRLAVSGKIFGGALFLSPEPDLDEPFYGFNAGVGLGVRYATLLTDVFVGLDGNFYASFAPSTAGSFLIIPAYSITPVIKYVF
jgi:hypothetical protein